MGREVQGSLRLERRGGKGRRQPEPSMTIAPQGTVTFLFTDMVGSTRLWEKHPQEMQEVVQRHDRMMRETMEGGGGHVFKTVGDAFCVAFATPRAALNAALAAQARLRETDWGMVGPIKVRMGLHSGTAEFRDADYFGGTLNRAARIESAAHGGQILMSQATRELLEDVLPDGVSLRALGQHRLRNLDRPEHLFEVQLRGWEEVYPPPRSLEVMPNNLPLQMTSFIGRERELEQVQRGVEAGRLHQLGDRWLCGLALWGLVHVVLAQKDLVRAQSALAEWYAIVRSLGNRWVIPFILDLQAELALLRSEPVRAARLIGAAEQWRTYFNEPLKGLDKDHFEDMRKRMIAHLEDERVREAWEAGRSASPWELLDEGVL